MTFSPLLAIPLFVLLLLLLEAGRLLRSRSGPDTAPNTTLESALFALLGLLLAFTFSGAMARYDAHRQLIVQEVNAIGTAYLRLDLLPPEAQPPIRLLFRQYVSTRLHQYDAPLDQNPETTSLQQQIWIASVRASARPFGSSDATKLLIPALNDMIDITATRQNAFRMHPPAIVFLLLFSLSSLCALLAGYNSLPSRRRLDRHLLMHISFAAAIALTIYATLEIEAPERGLIRLADQDRVFANLLTSIQ